MTDKPTLLVVDDEPEVIQALAGILSDEFNITIAMDGAKALEMASKAPHPDLILLDILLPGLGGFEVCRQLKEKPETGSIPIIFISVLDAVEDESYGFEMGAADYITKPFSAPIVQARVKTHLALYDQRRDLEGLVQARTSQLRDSRLEIIRQLGRAAEYKDNETGYHVIRMSFYARLLALKAGLSEEQAELLFNAAPMHDVGKIGIPDYILQKPGKLNAEEWAIMRRHCEYGANIIGNSDSDLMQLAREVAMTHHERWDGKGYPKGLKGEEIPIVGRIVAISDVFDALVSTRPYKSPWPVDQALEYILEQSGSQFDPELGPILGDILPEVLGIASCYRDDANDGTCH
ncbi:MAG: response regulator [Motiliproteus sp.]|nr:response regulator [Motiliproteus sp.]